MYAKLFASIYQGTLRGNTHGLVVFTNLLAHADAAGWVDIHPRAISDEVGLTVAQVEAALLGLEAPDPESRSPEENGRRIIRLDEHRAWGWRIVNHAKYRSIRCDEDRREQNRIAQAKWREKQARNADSNENKPRKPRSAQAEAEAEAEQEDPSDLVALAAPKRRVPCPTAEIIAIYHDKLPMLPRVEVMNDSRKRALSARWREVVCDQEIAKADDVRAAALDWWAWFFGHCAKSRFLTGKVKNWRADLDFLITPSKFARAVEGAYHKEPA